MSAAAESLLAAPIARGTRPPWLQWLIGKILHGAAADRPAKARARIGLAIIAFAAVYSVIAARLVMFALASDSHAAHRVVSSDAIATARPDILDRNGTVLATDVRVPSLYAEPRRLIDVAERGGRAERGPRRDGGSGGNKRAAAQDRHGQAHFLGDARS